jgi:hypothetical protein
LVRRIKKYAYVVSRRLITFEDFCYAVNVSCMLQSKYRPDDTRWFRINFICALGPLCAAIPLWRNSLVFHR